MTKTHDLCTRQDLDHNAELFRFQTLVCQVSYINTTSCMFFIPALYYFYMPSKTDTSGTQSAMLPPVLFDTFSAVSVSVLSFIVITQPSRPQYQPRYILQKPWRIWCQMPTTRLFHLLDNLSQICHNFGIATSLCKYIFIGAIKSFPCHTCTHHSPQNYKIQACGWASMVRDCCWRRSPWGSAPPAR